MALLDNFRNLSRKASAVSALIVEAMTPGQPVYTPRDFAALAREGFSSNVYVFRAVMTVAQATAAIPWKATQGKKKKELDTDHPLVQLLKKPNKQDGGTRFWTKYYAFYYLAGNSYIQVTTQNNKPTGAPIELWSLRPDRMQVIPDAKNYISGYKYSVAGQSTVLDAWRVLHSKTFNPLDDWYGLSPISIAARSIDQFNAAQDWNTALLQNSARPPGALATDTKLDKEEREVLKGDLKRLFQGPRNAGRPMLLEGGLRWTPMGTAPADMEWLGGKVQNAREIAIGIGVAPELLGDSANKTYSNVQEARKALYSEAVLPLAYMARDDLSNWLLPMFGDDYEIEPDTSGIEALQEDLQTKRTFVLSAWQGTAITLNETRKELGYEELGDAGEVMNVKGVLVPVDQLVDDGEDDTQAAALPPGGTLAQLPPAPNNDNPIPTPPIPTASDLGLMDEKRLVVRYARKQLVWTPESRAVYWHSFDQKRADHSDTARTLVSKQLAAMQTTVVRFVKNAPDTQHLMARLPHLLRSFDQDWQGVLSELYTTVGEPFARETYTHIMRAAHNKSRATRRKADWNDAADQNFDDPISDYLRAYSSKKITSIDDTILDTIRDNLASGVSDGESIDDLAARIDQLFLDQIIPNRSEVIARTEVISASNLGSRVGAIGTGLDLEQTWLATRGPRTRDTHADADGQTVALDEPFAVGDSQMMFPGDASLGASAGETINCRCTQTFQLAGAA